MKRFAILLIFNVLGLLAFPSGVAGQTTTGTIDGVVADPSGGVLPGVQVIANSPSLIQRDFTVYTDERGYFRLARLSPGVYEVEFVLQGFRRVRSTDLVVRVGQTTREDVVLELAGTQAMVTVTAEAPLIDPRSAKLAFAYTSALSENIPTARGVNNLFATIPGVQSGNNMGIYQPGVIEVQTVLSAGERANSYSLDGANVTDPAGQWNMQSYMPYDTIAEVQVVKSAKPAEIPFQGGFFNTITKAGGNNFSGIFGGYYSSDALQSTNGVDIRNRYGIESTNRSIKSSEVTASLGGRIVRDRLWWYGSARWLDDTSTAFGFPADITNEISSLSGKLTWQANADHRFTGVATRFEQDVSHFLYAFAPSLALDVNATAVRPVDAVSGGINWSGILGKSLLAELNVMKAAHGFDQLPQPGATRPPIVDLATGQRSQNLGDGTRVQDNDNLSISGSLEWFIPNAAGRHDVKVGFEYTPTTSKILFDDFEDHRLHTLRGNTFAVRFLSTPSLAVWDNDMTALYAQDDWSIGSRLTLNVGARFTRTVAGTPAQDVSGGRWAGTAIAARFPALEATTLPATELVNWNTIEPRFALAYGLSDSGRTILRAGASRYYHQLPSFGLFVSNPAFPLNYVTLWFDRNQDKLFQIGEDGRLLFSFGGQLNPVDKDLRRPYTDEFMVGLSHEVTRTIQLSANLIYRKDIDLAATIDAGVPFDRYTPVDIVDPGPDGATGTGDDGMLTVFSQDPDTIGLSRNLLTNPTGNERTYKGLELTASKRFSNNWQGVASLVVSEMEVVQPTVAASTTDLFDNPNGLINAKGLDLVSPPLQLKVQGTYVFPFGLSTSGFYSYAKGTPYTRELVVTDLPQGPFNVFAEPRGSSRTDNASLLDVRLEQTFDVGRTTRFGLILDVFNVFNASTIIDYGKITGVDYGDPQAIRNPRQARLGLRLMW